METLDRVTDPDIMSKLEYKDLLEDLQGEIESRLEAVSMELEEDEDADQEEDEDED